MSGSYKLGWLNIHLAYYKGPEVFKISFDGNACPAAILGPHKEEARGEFRQICSEKLHDLYWSCNIITVMKSVRRRWAGHVAPRNR
jgi:hypothetical protein